MKRRSFLKKGAATASIMGLGISGMSAMSGSDITKQQAANSFQLKYAPHLGMFKNLAGEDPIDQLNFMADQGFNAFEDNGMKNRSVSLK